MFVIGVRVAVAWPGRHRIDTAGVAGMAFQNSLERQPTAFQGAMNLDGFHCVLRTAGPEATAWAKQRTNDVLIAAQQADHDTGEALAEQSHG